MKKRFSSIEEWLKTSPSQEIISKLLEGINQGINRENRKLLKEKEQELEGITNTIRRMDRYNLPVSEDIKKKINGLIKEIDQIKKSIPPSKYSPKKPKE